MSIIVGITLAIVTVTPATFDISSVGDSVGHPIDTFLSMIVYLKVTPIALPA